MLLNQTNGESAPTLPLLVAISPDAADALAIKLYGEMYTVWQTTIVTEVRELQQLKAAPKLVVMHATMTGDWSYEDFLPTLKELGWTGRTSLVTGKVNVSATERLNAQSTAYGLKAIIPRPMEMERLAGWVSDTASDKQPTELATKAARFFQAARDRLSNKPSSPSPTIAEFADELVPAVIVLRQKSADNYFFEEVFANVSAKKINSGKLDDNDMRRLGLLLDLLPSAHEDRRAKILDWDTRKEQWVECRLHALSNEHYWYTRDWRNDDVVEEEFARLEDKPYLNARFDRLADYLAERWEITRTRLYQIEHLPEGLGRLMYTEEEKKADEMPSFETIYDVAHSSLRRDWIVVPRLHAGGGFLQALGQPGDEGAAFWWSQCFRWSDFVSVRDSSEPNTAERAYATFDMPRRNIDPDCIRPSEQYLYEDVSRSESCKAAATGTVAWGDATHRLLLMVPKTPSNTSKKDGDHVPQQRALVGMLAVDRRHDHLERLVKRLTITLPKSKNDEREIERIAKAAGAGRLSHPMDEQTVKAMTGGPMRAISDHLGRWFRDDHERRVRKWHSWVSEEVLAELQGITGSGGMNALSAICGRLRMRWLWLWEHERDRAKQIPLSDATPPIGNWFFVTERSAKRMDAPAGDGEIWEHYSGQSDGLPQSALSMRLFAEDIEPWTFLAVQDYAGWLERNWESVESKHRSLLNKTKSWLAIRLPTPQGFPKALMVLHFCEDKDAAWASLIHLLVVTAKRLYPPFMLALSEQHERTQWAAAVMHEMKNETLAIQAMLREVREVRNLTALRDNGAVSAILATLNDQVHGLTNLSEDYLSTLDDRYAAPDEGALETGEIRVAEQIRNALSPWMTRYRAIQVEGHDVPTDWLCNLYAHRLWRRVIRVLLHNAFRHGIDKVTWAADLTADSLVFTVTNNATDTAISHLEALNAHGENAQQAAFVRLRVGLRSAHRLVDDVVGASLTRTIKQDTSNWVTHLLAWPIATTD